MYTQVMMNQTIDGVTVISHGYLSVTAWLRLL